MLEGELKGEGNKERVCKDKAVEDELEEPLSYIMSELAEHK